MGYFLTHLLFLDKIRHAPRYELDMQQLRTKSKEAFPYALLSLAQDNLSLISDIVPTPVFLDCGLDFDCWYPLPRHMVSEHQRHILNKCVNGSMCAAAR
jgi:hypothetical protein